MTNTHRTFTDEFVTWIALAGGIIGTSIELMLVAGAPASTVHRINSAWGLAFTLVPASLLILRRPNALACISAGVVAITAAVVTTGGAEVDRARIWLVGVLFTTGIVLPLVTKSRKVIAATFAVATPTVIALTRAPDEAILDTVGIGATFALIYVAAVYQVMRIVRDVRRREARKSANVRYAPIATWEQDYTRVVDRIAELRADGVTDLRAWLAEHPRRLHSLLDLCSQGAISRVTFEVFECDDRDEFTGPNALRTLGPGVESAVVEQMVAISEARHHVVTEVKANTFKGRTIDIQVYWAVPFFEGLPDYSHVVLATVDLTAQKQAERRLEDEVAAKDAFVAAVSHELRTPLTAVVGIAEELSDNRGVLSAEEVGELIGIMASEGRDLSNIVDDLLVAARIDLGQVTIALERCELSRTIERVTPYFSCQARLNAELWVKADPHRVRQIVRNLLTNAKRYGGPNVILDAFEADGVVQVEVRDDGAGIPEDMREQVFEPYQRAEPRPGLTASVGLGLTISRNLAELMDGALEYEYTDDWSVFRLVLPAA